MSQYLDVAEIARLEAGKRAQIERERIERERIERESYIPPGQRESFLETASDTQPVRGYRHPEAFTGATQPLRATPDRPETFLEAAEAFHDAAIQLRTAIRDACKPSLIVLLNQFERIERLFPGEEARELDG